MFVDHQKEFEVINMIGHGVQKDSRSLNCTIKQTYNLKLKLSFL